jgi:hypothetical protein
MVESMGELEGAATLWHRAHLINSNKLGYRQHISIGYLYQKGLRGFAVIW